MKPQPDVANMYCFVMYWLCIDKINDMDFTNGFCIYLSCYLSVHSLDRQSLFSSLFYHTFFSYYHVQ